MDLGHNNSVKVKYNYGLCCRSMFTVTPGSEQIRATIERDGIVSNLKYKPNLFEIRSTIYLDYVLNVH